MENAFVAKEAKILAVLRSEALQFGCGQVVRLKPPEPDNAPRPGNFSATGTEVLRYRRQTLRDRLQVECEALGFRARLAQQLYRPFLRLALIPRHPRDSPRV